MVRSVVAQTALPLIVSPVRQELSVTPGESTGVTIKFYNQSDTPVSGIIRVADFVVDNKNGFPRIIDNPDQAPPKFEASTWFSLPYDRMTIAATDKVEVPAQITIPQDARPGGRYIAIYFEPVSNLPGGNGVVESGSSAVATRIASLVYLKVPGNFTESARVSNFFAPSLLEYGPVSVQTEILNKGDYHISPIGSITLSNMFGGLVAQSSLQQVNIFPDVSRTYQNDLGSKWMFGRYKVTLTAAYGDKGRVLEQHLYVWVLPWKLMAIVVLALLIIWLLGKNMFKKLAVKEAVMEEELAKEKAEIEKLKQELRRKKE